MKTIQLKTNIMCGACVAKVTVPLNNKFGESNWKVDTQNPNKVLTVSTDDLSAQEVMETVEKAGYRAEPLS